MNTPMLARAGTVSPPKVIMVWPIFGARQGVEGERMMSMSLKIERTCF